MIKSRSILPNRLSQTPSGGQYTFHQYFPNLWIKSSSNSHLTTPWRIINVTPYPTAYSATVCLTFLTIAPSKHSAQPCFKHHAHCHTRKQPRYCTKVQIITCFSRSNSPEWTLVPVPCYSTIVAGTQLGGAQNAFTPLSPCYQIAFTCLLFSSKLSF